MSDKISSEITKNIDDINSILTSTKIENPIWVSVSEAAKIGGVNQKTIRRAIQGNLIKFKIYKDRYLLSLRSVIIYLHSNTKLKNKFIQFGIGQYFDNLKK